MNLSDLLASSRTTGRFEKKIILSEGYSTHTRLFLNFNGFRQSYKNRSVTSIYFDDFSLTCWRDNIDGNMERDKLRVRYYDNDYSTAKLEIKHKRSYVGYKTTLKIPYKTEDFNSLISYAQKWASAKLNRTFVACAKVNYERSYFQYKNFRATMDTKVTCSRILGNSVIDGGFKRFEVLEFKYPPQDDEEFRDLYNKISRIALRTTKSSKYSIAMDF